MRVQEIEFSVLVKYDRVHPRSQQVAKHFGSGYTPTRLNRKYHEEMLSPAATLSAFLRHSHHFAWNIAYKLQLSFVEARFQLSVFKTTKKIQKKGCG